MNSTVKELLQRYLKEERENVKKFLRPRESSFRASPRVPPGQFVTEKFPVLTCGETPHIDLAAWEFQVFGLVEQPVRLSYPEFIKLPKAKVVADFHCVTQWSHLNCEWEGVPFMEVARLARPRPETRFAMVHCYGGYTTNLSLEALLEDDVLLAYKMDGRELELGHGWPVRLVVPSRYGWKSAKWVRGIELMAEDMPGFWEARGYHMEGDPFKEQRFHE
jgi:DMSO/TMAO reductase YedYZ molybdopterin-dependent catalytic subunit